MVRNTLPFFLPNPAEFRTFVQDALPIVGVSAQSISRELGFGRNVLGQFLATPGRSIHLSTAHDISCKLVELADAKGAALPQIGAANV